MTYGSSSSLPPAMRHHSQLGRKALHVLRLFAQKTLRDEQREIGVLVARRFETVVELALQRSQTA